ncbi:MAG: amino acid ABC transporter permease [Lentisphaeria bacterium]|nr:amino acid ABC transporter permease [Lentisphaeria bacterium]
MRLSFLKKLCCGTLVSLLTAAALWAAPAEPAASAPAPAAAETVQIPAGLRSGTAGLNWDEEDTDLSEENVSFWGSIRDSFELNFAKDQRWVYLAKGFGVTMEVSVFAVMLGVCIGFLVAVIRSTADLTGKLRLLNLLCKVYLTVIRGTPVVVQLLIIYFVIFGSCDVDKVLVAIIAFGVNSGAYVAEIIRSGISSIDPGQLEAARSLGLSYPQSMKLVILPQAIKNVLPALGNEFIVLLKETSVSGYIALMDLTKGGDVIRSQTYDAFLPLIAVAAIYLAVVMLFSWLLSCFERRLKKNER